MEKALAAGHEVIAFVRNPAKLAVRERLTVVSGDVRDADALTEAMRGTDAVISALGLDSAAPKNLSADSTRAIVHAAQRSGNRGPDPAARPAQDRPHRRRGIPLQSRRGGQLGPAHRGPHNRPLNWAASTSARWRPGLRMLVARATAYVYQGA